MATGNDPRVHTVKCPICGFVFNECRNEDGIIKWKCPKCKKVTEFAHIGRRHVRFDVYESGDDT